MKNQEETIKIIKKKIIKKNFVQKNFVKNSCHEKPGRNNTNHKKKIIKKISFKKKL